MDTISPKAGTEPVMAPRTNNQNENADGIGDPERKITRSYWARYFRQQAAKQVHPLSPESRYEACGKYNAASAWARRVQTLKILSVSLLALVGLLAFVIVDVFEAQVKINTEKESKEAVDISLKVAGLIHTLQIERGTTVLCISSQGSRDVGTALAKARQDTDIAINKIVTWPSGQDSLKSREIFIKTLTDYRQNGIFVNCLLNSTIQEALQLYTGMIDTMLDWLFASLIQNNQNRMVYSLIGYRMLLIAKEKTGLERAIGGSFFSRGQFSNEELILYARHNIIGQLFLSTSMDYMPSLRAYLDFAVEEKGYANRTLLDHVNAKRKVILNNASKQGNVSEAQEWFKQMTDYINILLMVQDRAGDRLNTLLGVSISSSENALIIRLVTLSCVIMLTPILFIAVTRMTNTIQQYALKLADATKDLTQEQQRTDDLLSAMFPRPVAETLKKGERVPSEQFDCVTVFFCDIVNFTNICAIMTPMLVTRMLNDIYSVFDNHIDKYDVYKVETIGDAYMVVSGLPIRNGSQHADEIGRMSLDLVQLTENLTLKEIPAGEKILIRVGIHTGPCVAGVVGNKMPRYCLFGDTVNTASRMQTTGIPQKIHISEDTHELLEKFNTYEMEHRGSIDVKGKGTMETYWLLGTTDWATNELPGIINNAFNLLDE